MNIYDASIPLLIKTLGNVDRWFDKAIQSAQARKFDPETLLTARLAPDQYALTQQVQATCDTAKYGAAKLAGTEAPAHPDTEKTIAELRARLATARTYLGTFQREQFAGAEERVCSHVWMRGKGLRGVDYLNHHVLPNVYFHATTVYAILRHNGVDVGKTDFVAPLPFIGG